MNKSDSCLVIRKMEEEDLVAVAQIEKAIFSKPWSLEGFRTSLLDSGTVYLCACLDDKVIGYCGFLQVLDEADITNVAVDESCRRLGAAGEMLKELIRLGRDRGVCNFTLEVRESNLPAIALYEKLGFENCGIRKNFYDLPKEHAVIMWKRF